MEKYRRVESRKEQEETDEFEIKITNSGMKRRFIAIALEMFEVKAMVILFVLLLIFIERC